MSSLVLAATGLVTTIKIVRQDHVVDSVGMKDMIQITVLSMRKKNKPSISV